MTTHERLIRRYAWKGPLNNAIDIKGERRIRKGICGNQPTLTLPGIGDYAAWSDQPSMRELGWR